jgi:hypothetical protein
MAPQGGPKVECVGVLQESTPLASLGGTAYGLDTFRIAKATPWVRRMVARTAVLHWPSPTAGVSRSDPSPALTERPA